MPDPIGPMPPSVAILAGVGYILIANQVALGPNEKSYVMSWLVGWWCHLHDSRRSAYETDRVTRSTSIHAEQASTRAGLRVAMALYGDLDYDSRVIREAESLAAAGYVVTIVCLAASTAIVSRLAPTVRVVVRESPEAPPSPGEPRPLIASGSSRARFAVARVMWLWRYQRSLARWGKHLSDAAGPVDIWHAHDLTGLQAVAARAPQHVPIVYDSHELFLERGSAVHLPRLARRFLQWREGRLVRRCAAVVTVNPGLAAVLGRLYHPARIEVVRNCIPHWSPPVTRPNLIRELLGFGSEVPIALFHGTLQPDRGIDKLIAALSAPGLEDLHLVLLGFGQMRDALEIRACEPDILGRLHVLPAVSPSQIPEWVASADVGAVLMPPATLNLVLSSPNKLFEAIGVGTPVVASDLPEIARIVRDDPDGPLGVLCDPGDQQAIVAALRSLLVPPRTRLLDLRIRCLRAAESRLNWEMEARQLIGLYADLGAGWGPEGSHSSARSSVPAKDPKHV